MPEWGRRSYTVKDEGGRSIGLLGAKVTIEIGGKIHSKVELRVPGMIALLAHPERPGEFVIEMVEPGGKRWSDVRLPPESGDILPWQKQALGLL